MKNYMKTALLITSGYPFIWLVVFYSYMVRSYYHLGRWPRSVIDNSGIEGTIHDKIMVEGFLALPWVFIVCCATFLITWAATDKRTKLITLSLAGASIVVMIIIYAADPGGCVEWLLD